MYALLFPYPLLVQWACAYKKEVPSTRFSSNARHGENVYLDHKVNDPRQIIHFRFASDEDDTSSGMAGVRATYTEQRRTSSHGSTNLLNINCSFDRTRLFAKFRQHTLLPIGDILL